MKKNGTISQRFLKKFHELTNDLYEKWITKKMRNLFRLKSKNTQPACKEICTCK